MDPRNAAPPPRPEYDPRLRGDPSGAAPRADDEPPRREHGYERGAPPRPGRGLDLSALFVLLDSVRRAVPGELEERVTALIREFLLTLRSLIDWYLDRLDRPSREPRVEDIPIE
jgi:hypothetical protein